MGPTHCLPDRYGWFSDSVSIRDLLSVLLSNGSGELFCDTMGFTRQACAANGGYGTMLFMFYTERQLQQISDDNGVQFFRPYWQETRICLRKLCERRMSDGTWDAWVPNMWIVDPI